MADRFDVLLVPSHDVDDRVRQITQAQNKVGFRVIGWCRAPKESDQAISDAKVMHIVNCTPLDGLTDEAKLLRLKPQESEESVSETE